MTLAGGPRRGSAQDDVAVLRGGALAAVDGTIFAVGSDGDIRTRLRASGIDADTAIVLDASGRTVTPGLIDSHTHLLFAGTRERERQLRQRGATYLEILAAGGGILSTVAATRGASDDELLDHGRRWLGEMLSHGVTTAEVKSGYGLDRDTELRLLSIASRLGVEGPVEVVPTFLGAHAVPREFRERPNPAAAYADSIIREQLPAVAEQGHARFCDVFCEPEVFDVELTRKILEAADRVGLRARLHADELAPSGGAELAAQIGAASADHLACTSEAGIAALGRAAESGSPVVATLLPATTLNLMSERYAPARALIEAGVPVALATDFNPGTSPTPNLPLVLALACVKLSMTPSEALAAATINAAHSLGIDATHGSLEPGKQADIVVWDVPTYEQIPYWMGADIVTTVVKGGRVAYERMPIG